MFVGFIGAPNSGKTTIAAKVFAELKQQGMPNIEFITEEARRYIAEKRWFTDRVVLTDEDQYKIFTSQMMLEQTMNNAVGEVGVVIADSCAVNSLWYMSEAMFQQTLDENEHYFKWLTENAMLFYSTTVGIMNQADALRIHSGKASTEIDRKIQDLLLRMRMPGADLLHPNLRHLPVKSQLVGNLDVRVSKVISNIYERLTS